MVQPRITDRVLNARLDTVNGLLGFREGVDGSFTIYQAYGCTTVRRISGDSGGQSDIGAPFGTKREALVFLDGMVTALRIVL